MCYGLSGAVVFCCRQRQARAHIDTQPLEASTLAVCHHIPVTVEESEPAPDARAAIGGLVHVLEAFVISEGAKERNVLFLSRCPPRLVSLIAHMVLNNFRTERIAESLRAQSGTAGAHDKFRRALMITLRLS